MISKVDFDIKKAYFNWLCDYICDKKHEKIDYIPLLDKLFSMKFVVKLSRDENRISDGEDLRTQFLDEEGIDDRYLYEFDDMDVSILEVLIGIAKRLSFQVDNSIEGMYTNEHFWEILRNLDIEKYSSDNYKAVNISEKCDVWMSRRFKSDGSGSIFPLKNPESDQRKEEIWVQMSNYIWENYGFINWSSKNGQKWQKTLHFEKSVMHL